MAKPYLPKEIRDYLQLQAALGVPASSPDDIAAKVSGSRATVNRHLARMLGAGEVVRVGSGPATRYALPVVADTPYAMPNAALSASLRQPGAEYPRQGFRFPARARPLIQALQAPVGTRAPVTYLRSFVDAYTPNLSSLLPPALAAALLGKGKANGQQPAGTYARKVLEQLLIDLSWHSSRLEGNRKSLLDTRELFARGRTQWDDLDATMLLNHKDAIEFIVDAVPEYGIREDVVRNIQALLMQGLLVNPQSVGAIRRTLVNIADSVYLPAQAPHLLEEMLRQVIDKVRSIKNPVEAAFFMWVNIAYLQPFEDGNKRTSRLCANLPLLLQNCAPISFLDVEAPDYALAMLGIYEKQDVSLATDLFEWTYLRSIEKYEVILQSMGAPDPFRVKYRELLGEAIRDTVANRIQVEAVLAGLDLPTEDLTEFNRLLQDELRHLATYNCARYRLSIRLTEEWIRDGRPGLSG